MENNSGSTENLIYDSSENCSNEHIESDNTINHTENCSGKLIFMVLIS